MQEQACGMGIYSQAPEGCVQGGVQWLEQQQAEEAGHALHIPSTYHAAGSSADVSVQHEGSTAAVGTGSPAAEGKTADVASRAGIVSGRGLDIAVNLEAALIHGSEAVAVRTACTDGSVHAQITAVMATLLKLQAQAQRQHALAEAQAQVQQPQVAVQANTELMLELQQARQLCGLQRELDTLQTHRAQLEEQCKQYRERCRQLEAQCQQLEARRVKIRKEVSKERAHSQALLKQVSDMNADMKTKGLSEQPGSHGL